MPVAHRSVGLCAIRSHGIDAAIEQNVLLWTTQFNKEILSAQNYNNSVLQTNDHSSYKRRMLCPTEEENSVDAHFASIGSWRISIDSGDSVMRTCVSGATLNNLNARESMDERKFADFHTRYSAECTVLAAGVSPK
jgi:hypothetical protein